MKYKGCKGCKAYKMLYRTDIYACGDNVQPSILLMTQDEIVKCPCLKCLIKCVCKSPCEKFEKYRRYFDYEPMECRARYGQK